MLRNRPGANDRTAGSVHISQRRTTMHRPLHATVTDRLREMIISGKYIEGDQLPAEPVLAKELGVSRPTLREALKQLDTEGLLYRKHGSGTFVRSQRPALTMRLTAPRSLTVMLESLNMLAGTSYMKVSTEPVFPDDVERLGIKPGSEIVRIERIRTANGQPVAYTIEAVPTWVMKKYPRWDGASNFSLIEHLTYRCGVAFKETKTTLIPLHNVLSVADKLGIDPSSHIFFFEGIDRNTEGEPVLFSREYFAPWIFRISITRTFDDE